MPTIEDVIRDAELLKKSAERRLADANRDLTRFSEALDSSGAVMATPDQQARADALVRQKREAQDQISRADGELQAYRKVEAEESEYQRLASESHPTGAAHPSSRRDDDRPNALSRSQSMREWAQRESMVIGDAGSGLSFDRVVRGLATGDWRGAEAEQRALTESPLTAGGHMVPTPVALEVIDRARNAAQTLRAGVMTIPMTSQTLKYPRLTAEATPAWRNEGAAISDQAMTFDAVTFTARSMAVLVKASWELLEDAEATTEGAITNSFAEQIALELDRVVLRGSGTAPEPRGVLNQTGVTTTAHGANGAAITNYDFHLDAVGTVRNNNFEPNAQIQAPRTETSLSKLKEATTNAYLRPPSALDAIPRLNTKQVPTNLTVGTSVDCSELYTGQWDQCLLGIRTDLTIRFLQERFADTGEFAFLAYLRADVQLAQPTAFNVDTGVRG